MKDSIDHMTLKLLVLYFETMFYLHENANILSLCALLCYGRHYIMLPCKPQVVY